MFFSWVPFICFISQPISQKINWRGFVILSNIFDSPMDSPAFLRQSLFTWEYFVCTLNQAKPRAFKATYTWVWIFFKLYTFLQESAFLPHETGNPVTETALFWNLSPERYKAPSRPHESWWNYMRVSNVRIRVGMAYVFSLISHILTVYSSFSDVLSPS